MQSITDIDLGTPKRSSEKKVTVEIDGVNVSVSEGSSVMHAATVAGRQVPKLCATDSLEAFEDNLPVGGRPLQQEPLLHVPAFRNLRREGFQAPGRGPLGFPVACRQPVGEPSRQDPFPACVRRQQDQRAGCGGGPQCDNSGPARLHARAPRPARGREHSGGPRAAADLKLHKWVFQGKVFGKRGAIRRYVAI